jgi:hypothetical protein
MRTPEPTDAARECRSIGALGEWSHSGHKRPGIRWNGLAGMDVREHVKHVMDARRQPRFSL